ncbi:MAG: hypothetical protein J6M06_01025 [Synergistaceae bacterium]|nr:hypothetical protein [Synergistaceae bacterium]
MDKSSKAGVFTKEAIEAADKVPREEVKSIKHMSKPELVHYIQSVWQRGYDVGHREGYEHGVNDARAALNAKGVSEHTEENEGNHGDV